MAFQHQDRSVMPHSIDPREWEAVLKFVKDYHLEEKDPSLILQLQAINPEKPSSLSLKLWQTVKERISVYMKYHEENPYVTAPASATEGEFILARQKADNLPIGISKDGLSRHSLVVSSSGGGKTTFCHHLVGQVLDNGINAIIIDPKDDSRIFTVKHEDFLVLHSESPLNLLQSSPFLSKDEFFSVFITCFARAFYGAEHTKQVLNEALQRTFSQNSSPCIADLKKAVDSMYKKTDTYSRRDAVNGVSLRLQRINYNFPGIFRTSKGPSFEQLLSHSLYIPVTLMDETSEFIISYLIHLLYLHNRAKGMRTSLSNLVYLDEGLLTWSKNSNKIEGVPLLSYLQSMVREFGIGMLVTSTSITNLDPVLKSNSFLQVCMNLTNSQETLEVSRTFGLSPSQKEYLEKKLCLGECIIQMGDRWREPVLAVFPPLPYSKDVPLAEWEAAKRRILRYAPNEMTLNLSSQGPVDQKAEARNLSHQEIRQQSHADPLSKDEGIMPQSHPGPPLQAEDAQAEILNPRLQTPALKLSSNEENLLKVICKDLLPVTDAYKMAGLKPQSGHNAKKKLFYLALITEEPVLVKPGRGGKAVVLFPTPQAYSFLNRKPSKGTRGGDSAQHEYLVRSIQRLIPDSQLEFNLAGKSMDVFFLYQQALHRPFAEILRSLSQMENDFPSLQEGWPVTIEVECSDPAKTGLGNALKNSSVGISLTVLAVMPGQEESAAQALGALRSAPGAMVVGALDLLQAAREAYAPRKAT